MNLFGRLFNKTFVECPRCLGKGHVDSDDIKRLNRELLWIPGPCAYCNGQGTVPSSMLSKVSADNAYLTTNLPPAERKLVVNNDFEARQRALAYESELRDFIRQIEFLHFTGCMDAEKIMAFYLVSKTNVENAEREELVEFIEKVIEHKKSNPGQH